MVISTKQVITFDNEKEYIYIDNFEKDHPDWKKTQTTKYTMFQKIDEVFVET